MLDEIDCRYCLSRHSVVGRHVVAFSGSRERYWSHLPTSLLAAIFLRLLEKWGDARLVVSVGDATGIDRFVRDACDYYGVCYKVEHANWRDHGSFAGHERNTRVVEGADELIAIMPKREMQTPGTGNAILQAERKSLTVHEWRGRWIR